MSWATAVVLIVLISAIAGVLRSRNRRHFKSPNQDGSAKIVNSSRELELESEVKQLRERIHVLERIATDDRGAKSIADEIESLRDK